MSRNNDIKMRARRAVYERFLSPGTGQQSTDEAIVACLDQNSIEVIGSEKVKPGFSWLLNTTKFLVIEKERDHQFILGKRTDATLASTYYFTRVTGDGEREFYRVPRGDLQDVVMTHFQKRLDRWGNVRPRNPEADTFGLTPKMIAAYLVR